MNESDLAKILARKGYAITGTNRPVAQRLPRDQPEPKRRAALRRDERVEEKSGPRPVVIITRCSSGSLDRDNLGASAKALVDALRYHGFIAGDRERDIELITLQRKVKRGETGTLIEILPSPHERIP